MWVPAITTKASCHFAYFLKRKSSWIDNGIRLFHTTVNKTLCVASDATTVIALHLVWAICVHLSRWWHLSMMNWLLGWGGQSFIRINCLFCLPCIPFSQLPKLPCPHFCRICDNLPCRLVSVRGTAASKFTIALMPLPTTWIILWITPMGVSACSL